MKTKVLINGTDIGPDGLKILSGYKVNAYNYGQANNRTEIWCYRTVFDLVSFDLGSSVEIWRGVNTNSDYRIFKGNITSYDEDNGNIIITAKGFLWRLNYQFLTKSYDIAIDPQAGVVSAIWDDIITDGGLTTSVPTSSGTTNVLNKFICNDQTRLERAQKLAETLGWNMYEDYINNLVVLAPKGYISYTTPLTVGSNVINVPVWNYELDSMRNDITIKGAVAPYNQTETFSGTGAQKDFYTSGEAEALNISVGGVQKVRGTPSVTTTYDYTYDKELKKISFVNAPALGTNNISAIITYNIPMPVRAKNSASINQYGVTGDDGVKRGQEEVITFKDLRSVDDAKLRLKKILDNIGVPKLKTRAQTYNVMGLNPGMSVQVIDNVQGYNENMIVIGVEYLYPDNYDNVDLGDPRFDLQDFINTIDKRISALEQSDLNNNQILTQLLQNESEVELFSQLSIYKQNAEEGVLYYDSDTQGDWDDFNWGTDNGALYWGQGIWGTDVWGVANSTLVLSQRLNQSNKFFEDFYDNDMTDVANTTAVINTTSHRVEF
jgi:hypothetical protein